MADSGGNTTFDFGLDYSEFEELLKAVEQLEADDEEIAKKVVNAGVQAALPVFTANVPVGDGVNPRGRAKHNVAVSGLKTSKRGGKYKLISFHGDRSYLYILDKGSSKMPAHPWLDKAKKEAGDAAVAAMTETMRECLGSRLSRNEK